MGIEKFRATYKGLDEEAMQRLAKSIRIASGGSAEIPPADEAEAGALPMAAIFESIENDDDFLLLLPIEVPPLLNWLKHKPDRLLSISKEILEQLDSENDSPGFLAARQELEQLRKKADKERERIQANKRYAYKQLQADPKRTQLVSKIEAASDLEQELKAINMVGIFNRFAAELEDGQYLFYSERVVELTIKGVLKIHELAGEDHGLLGTIRGLIADQLGSVFAKDYPQKRALENFLYTWQKLMEESSGSAADILQTQIASQREEGDNAYRKVVDPLNERHELRRQEQAEKLPQAA